MISINKDILKGEEEDDIKPVLVTDMSADKIQDIIAGQKEADIQKQRKKKLKESKKTKTKTKKRESQWVEIDNEGNKVKALVENKEDKKERKKREKKDIRKEVKLKFLEEQAKKKLRKQELEEKLLGITAVEEDDDKPKRRRHDTDSDSDDEEEAQEKSKPLNAIKMDEMKSGLQSLDDLKKGIEENKKNNQMDEKEAFDQMKAQKTVYRDQNGRVIKGDAMSDMMLNPKDKLRKLNQERLNMWSQGVVQTQEKFNSKDQEELKAENDGKEYDRVVDQEYKEASRFGDPISEIRKHQAGTATDRDKRVLWSRKIFPPCKFEGTPNRFNILPGHRWDGVDRSNGFENRFLDQTNQQKANKELFYKWASKEM